MELKGKITSIGEVETFAGRDGQEFCSRQLVLTTEESHPQVAVFSLRHGIAADFAGQVGQEVVVHFDFAGFTGKDGRVYNKLAAWRVD